MAVEIDQFMCRSDNFGVLVHDDESGRTLLIDAPEEAPILAAIERTGWRPTALLITHHHGDHVEANLALKQKFGLTIVGPTAEAAKIPGIDQDGRRRATAMPFGAETIAVIDTPGHTAGHISYIFPQVGVAFAADTLFAIGCGRLLECKPPVMFHRWRSWPALPLETKVYCGHEYTQANARFALTVDPDQLRAEGARGRDRRGCAPTASRRCRPPSARNWRPTRSCAGTTRRSAAISAWRRPATSRCLPRSASARTPSEPMHPDEIIALFGMQPHPEGG